MDQDSRADLVAAVRTVHDAVRSHVMAGLAVSTTEQLTAAYESGAADTIYQVDRFAERRLLDLLAEHLAAWLPIAVVVEGLPDVGFGDGVSVLPSTADLAAARHWVIIDPIDGTRGLMYGKRSAWILTGVAEAGAAGRPPRLADIEVAVQTEIPTPKQTLADTLWAVRGAGARAVRTDLVSGTQAPLALHPSTATTLEHGFGQVMRGFPGGRDLLAAVDDEICRLAGPPAAADRAGSFEDQYISTGGQLAELAYGHDRWIADLRPLLVEPLAARGLPSPLCCHPYDMCSALIAEECGVVITGLDGGPVDAPLDTQHKVGWIGYANPALRARIEPALTRALRLLRTG